MHLTLFKYLYDSIVCIPWCGHRDSLHEGDNLLYRVRSSVDHILLLKMKIQTAHHRQKFVRTQNISDVSKSA